MLRMFERNQVSLMIENNTQIKKEFGINSGEQISDDNDYSGINNDDNKNLNYYREEILSIICETSDLERKNITANTIHKINEEYYNNIDNIINNNENEKKNENLKNDFSNDNFYFENRPDHIG
jgi:organic radical activating enzyme